MTAIVPLLGEELVQVVYVSRLCYVTLHTPTSGRSYHSSMVHGVYF